MRVVFEKNTLILRSKEVGRDVLGLIKPKYPWSEEWLFFFRKQIGSLASLRKQNDLLKNRVKELENRLKESEYKNTGIK